MMEVPARRLHLAPIRQQATLQQAHILLNDPGSGVEALYVVRTIGPTAERITGIVTQDQIEAGYQAAEVDRY